MFPASSFNSSLLWAQRVSRGGERGGGVRTGGGGSRRDEEGGVNSVTPPPTPSRTRLHIWSTGRARVSVSWPTQPEGRYIPRKSGGPCKASTELTEATEAPSGSRAGPLIELRSLGQKHTSSSRTNEDKRTKTSLQERRAAESVESFAAKNGIKKKRQDALNSKCTTQSGGTKEGVAYVP